MEQRRLRLGDIVDDYCPRERRVTNHAVVAMVEEGVKQTRCTTCDAEHPYKGGQAPRRRTRKDSTGTLYKEVLAGITDSEPASAPVLTPAPHHAVAAEPESSLEASSNGAAPDVREAGEESPGEPAEQPEPAAVVEEGPVHRQLIRATLPKIEGQKEERRAPEFTIRQPGGRPNGNFRGDGRARPHQGAGSGQFSNRGQGNGTGNRFAGARANGNPGRSNQGRGQGGGARSSAQPQGRGGRKRSR